MCNLSRFLGILATGLLAVLSACAQPSDSLPASETLSFSKQQLFVPVGLMAIGAGLSGNGKESLKNELVEDRNEMMPGFRTRIDNYLQFSSIALTYGFEAFGMRPKTDIGNQTIILAKSELFMMAAVTLLKNVTHSLRPDSSAYNSFPSGHSAQAFAAAAFLAEEYGYRYHWVPFLAYGLAGSVGMLRMANNRHFISDVLAGAGLGILATKLAYWTHHYRWGRPKRPLPNSP